MDSLWRFHLIKETHLLKYATSKNVFESHLQTSMLKIQHFILTYNFLRIQNQMRM